MMGNTFTIDNLLIQNYAFYSSLLVIKMLIMSPLTSRHRLTKNIFVNKEDAVFFWKGKTTAPKVTEGDFDVERVRRSHLNDLENIPAFLFISGLYLLTNPAVNTAALLMKTYTLSRFLHTIVYAVFVVPQPARVISWSVGYGITFYMAFKVAAYFM